MFEDITQFPFVVELEKNWQVIRDEMVAVVIKDLLIGLKNHYYRMVAVGPPLGSMHLAKNKSQIAYYVRELPLL
jgi:hypothetical protein